MNVASLHVGSPDGITPTRSGTITKAKVMKYSSDCKWLTITSLRSNTTARRHEMTEELNGSNAVASINVIAKVPSVHERAVSLALLEGFGSPSAKPLPQILLLDASRALSSRAHCGTAATGCQWHLSGSE